MVPDKRPFIQLLDMAQLKRTILPGSTVLVGVSGGADSMALLHALSAVSDKLNLIIHVAHINHQLRPESDHEESAVMKLCETLNINCHLRRLPAEKKPSGYSPEEFWRQQRYLQFNLLMSEISADYLALGHTADDMAETFLHHLTRGTGLDGLVFSFAKKAGIITVIRPLWKTRRSAIEAALNQAGQVWFEDSSNRNVRYSRNLIRHEVIPQLEKINPNVVDAIIAVSDDLSQLAVNQATVPILPDEDELDLNSLRGCSTTACAKAIREFVRQVSGTRLSRQQTGQATGMIQTGKSGLVSLSEKGTLVLTTDRGWIYPGSEPSNQDLAIAHCTRHPVVLAEIQAPLQLSESQAVEMCGLNNKTHLITRIDNLPLKLRNRQPGDHIGSKSLKKLLIEHRFPWYLRDYLVFTISDAGEVTGLVGFDEHPLNKWFARRGRGFSLPHVSR